LGLYIIFNCNNNTISGNTANGNHYGIYLHQCDNNTISGNTVNGNEYGIYLESNCDYNSITENVVYNNTRGIYIEDTDCGNNSLYKNFFLENGKHAYDGGTDNTWKSTTIGNYWDNHTGPDTTPQDGIVDEPYTYIGGSAGSVDYFPIAEDGAPSITINSLSDDDVFGSNTPSYDVTMTDNSVFEIWYTLDGGLHNYTFTELSGNIEQSAWDALSDGMITLSFYASDIPGNMGTADVSIIKDTVVPLIIIDSPSPGAEFGATAPAFIVTITDYNLDSVWYSLDGGLTTYAITTNATIDQAAWVALSEGSITITFYTNDTAGNLTFEEVTITKNIPAGGIDPSVIIVIIVVSVVGGVAVIAGVYIFMKKRATPE